jgi:thiol-disulfide isomerase/thioredoxin
LSFVTGFGGLGLARVAGALVAILLMATGCAADNPNGPVGGGGQQGYPEVGRRLTQIPPEQRRPAPEVSGPALGSGETLSSTAYPGKVVVLNVWGSWCGPCRKEAPDLQAASEQTKDTAQFLGINTKDRSEAAAEAFVRANKLTYPSIYDPDGRTLLAFAGDLPPSAIPSTMIIDTQGRLAVRVLGDLSRATLVAMISDVASGK